MAYVIEVLAGMAIAGGYAGLFYFFKRWFDQMERHVSEAQRDLRDMREQMIRADRGPSHFQQGVSHAVQTMKDTAEKLQIEISSDIVAFGIRLEKNEKRVEALIDRINNVSDRVNAVEAKLSSEFDDWFEGKP